MTTGAYTHDYRFPHGDGVVGDLVRRNWQGSDSVKDPAKAGIPYTAGELASLEYIMRSRFDEYHRLRAERRRIRLLRKKKGQRVPALPSTGDEIIKSSPYYSGFAWKPPKWKVPPQRPAIRRSQENDYQLYRFDTIRDKPVVRQDQHELPPYDSSTSLIGGMNPAEPSRHWDANDDIALIGKLREKIAGSDFNPAVFLVEWHKSLGMIFDAATRIGGAFSYMRKGNFLAASRFLTNGTGRAVIDGEVPARNWLELQYGWLPLLSDAHTAAMYLATTGFGYLERTYHVTRQKSFSDTYGLGPGLNPGESANMFFNRYKKKIKAVVRHVDKPQLDGLSDPRAAIWEALPYSFVLDWFIPIQDYLQAASTSKALTGTFVTSQVHKWGALGVSDFSKPWKLTGPMKDTFFVVTGNMSRSAAEQLDVPFATAKSPKRALSLTHALNALALLRVAQSESPVAGITTFTDIRRVMGKAGVFR